MQSLTEPPTVAAINLKSLSRRRARTYLNSVMNAQAIKLADRVPASWR